MTYDRVTRKNHYFLKVVKQWKMNYQCNNSSKPAVILGTIYLILLFIHVSLYLKFYFSSLYSKE